MTEGKPEETKREKRSAYVEQEGDGGKVGVDEMNSLVSELFTVEELRCQISTSAKQIYPRCREMS